MNGLKKIIIKIIVLLLVFQIVSMPFSSPVKAENFWGNVLNFGEKFVEDGRANSQTSASDEEVVDIIGILYNSLLTLGVIISVAVGGALGIKFMTSSAEDKAKVKESLVPYVAGCMVIFGAFTIWKICINIFSKI